MPSFDNERERQRLAAVYAGMTEGELRQVAADAADLTEEATQSLYQELQNRGLELPVLVPISTCSDIELRELIVIEVFRDLPEALLAQGMLQSAGIQGFLSDDNLVRMDWFWSNAVGGVKLKVSPQDAQAAKDILRQPRPEEFRVEGMGNYRQPRCPKCQSMDVSFEELDKATSYFTAWIHLPIPVHLKDWRCRACGAKWRDGDESE